MNVDEMMRRASKDLEEAEAQLAAAEGRVAELKTIRDGLRFAVQRYGQGQAVEAAEAKMVDPVIRVRPVAPKPSGGTSLGGMVLKVLGDAGRPLSTSEVRESVNALGQQMNKEQARSALHYLLRKERIGRVGPGLWVLPERSAKGFGPADGTAGPNGTGENPMPYTLGFSPERA